MSICNCFIRWVLILSRLGNRISPISDARCTGRQHSKKHSQTQLLLNVSFGLLLGSKNCSKEFSFSRAGGSNRLGFAAARNNPAAEDKSISGGRPNRANEPKNSLTRHQKLKVTLCIRFSPTVTASKIF